MKKIVIIQSHCDNDYKIKVLKDTISKFKNLNLDILLFSHIILPQEITSMCDFFVYDNTNPVLWEEKRFMYWYENNNFRLETTVPDYGWTVFNQIKKSYNLIKDEGYEIIYISCYDLEIDDLVVNTIKNNEIGKFRHYKPDGVNFETGLIFMSLDNKNANHIIERLNKEEYINNKSIIAEDYISYIINELNINLKSIGNVKDIIHQSDSKFNDSKNVKYEIFVDTDTTLKFIYKKIDNSIDHNIIINDKIIKVYDEILNYTNEIPILKRFGVFIGNEYEDLLETFKIRKHNKIFYKK